MTKKLICANQLLSKLSKKELKAFEEICNLLIKKIIMKNTIPAYLEDLPLDILEQELETAQKELKVATKEELNASAYGGFTAKIKIARRKKSVATEAIKFIRLELSNRRYD